MFADNEKIALSKGEELDEIYYSSLKRLDLKNETSKKMFENILAGKAMSIGNIPIKITINKSERANYKNTTLKKHLIDTLKTEISKEIKNWYPHPTFQLNPKQTPITARNDWYEYYS